jgi:hypothetical protein
LQGKYHMDRLIVFNIKIYLTTLTVLILFGVNHTSGQSNEEPAINWAEWNVSVAYLTEADILETSLINDIYYLYNLTNNDGIAYSVAKPLGRYLTAGLEMSELKLEGYRHTAANIVGYWIWPERYSTRIQNFNLILRFHPFSQWTVNPFLVAKTGISGVIARVHYPSVHFSSNTEYYYKTYLEKKSRPSFKELNFSYGAGITWNAGSLLSFDIGFEINTVSTDDLQILPPQGFGMKTEYSEANIAYGCFFVRITSHSDISKLFRKKRNPLYNDNYESKEYLPFYKKRKRK